MFGIFKKKTKYPYKPPSKSQIEECERLGLKIKPKMSSHDVLTMINESKKIPKYKKIDEEYRKKQRIIELKDLEDEYGSELVKELDKWESKTINQHIIIYKKGKTITSDIIEFDSVEIEDSGKPYVEVSILRPKIYKPKNDSHYIEWEKEVSLKSNQILFCSELKKEIDMFDLDRFDKELTKTKQLEKKYSEK